ncbi:MAG: alpha/beta hydrolase, partial [Deltaproteobacteria bacterium]|nr:alpha/beta hydrolase [Deltaproteobacteria bacterium]
GVDIYYEREGAGEPVLFVPASWWPSDPWKLQVVPTLSRRWETVIMDCRGTGRSSQPDDGYTVTQFAEDCAALLAHLGITRCHVVGFAIGGQILQALAIARPDLVATLTMTATGPGSRNLSGAPREVSPETHAQIREMGFEQYIKSHVDNDGMAFNPTFYHANRAAAAALADALWSGQSTVEMFRRHERARLTWDALAAAPDVKVSTLVLCGEDDKVERQGSTPVDTARRLGRATPGAELALIPGVRHMTFWDGTGAIDALEDFLARHPIG